MSTRHVLVAATVLLMTASKCTCGQTPDSVFVVTAKKKKVFLLFFFFLLCRLKIELQIAYLCMGNTLPKLRKGNSAVLTRVCAVVPWWDTLSDFSSTRHVRDTKLMLDHARLFRPKLLTSVIPQTESALTSILQPEWLKQLNVALELSVLWGGVSMIVLAPSLVAA